MNRKSTKESVREKVRPPRQEAPAAFGLGGLFDGLQKLIEAAGSLQEGGEINKTGEFTVPGLGEKGKGIFGFSVRTMAGGGQGVQVQPFGNIHKTKEGMAVEETREPVVDVLEEGDRIRVIVELPGVSEAEIQTAVDGDILTIATTGDHCYRAEVLLPAQVDAASLKSSYRNGVLEVKLARPAKG